MGQQQEMRQSIDQLKDMTNGLNMQVNDTIRNSAELADFKRD